jgi:hypothetical protein
MATRGAGKLGDSKGGDTLAELLKAMKPVAPPRPSPASAEDLAAANLRRSRVAPPATEQGRRAFAVAKAKAKSKKEVIKMSARAKHEALQRAGPISTMSRPVASPSEPTTDFGAAAFQRVARLRPRLEGFVADDRAPEDVDSDTRTVIERRVALGESVSRAIVDPDADGYIGHDFGTSATKAVVRWPYDRSLGASAILVPAGWCSGGVPHLWPTVVYFDPSAGTFSLLPGEGLKLLAGFKAALIEGRGHRMCRGSSVTMAEAATAFLAMHLAYVLGSIAEARPSARIGAVNLGVPVAARADEKVFSIFSDIAAAACRLLGSAPTLSLDDVRLALALSDIPQLPFDLHTELAAAIAGYCASPRYYRGAHMIVDCGSATLDIASFHLGDGRWPVGIHAAGVELLGADACAVYQTAGASAAECGDAAYYHEHRIYAGTLDFARASFKQDTDGRYPYQMILIGGGIEGAIHKPLLERMSAAFQRPFHCPQLDSALVCERGAHAGRLILADGLANAPFDLREVAMPRDRPPQAIHYGPDPTSKDIV